MYFVETRTFAHDGWTGWCISGQFEDEKWHICRCDTREIALETARLLNEYRARHK